MRYPLDELIDKRSIIQLKIERIEDYNERRRILKEFSDYTFAIAQYLAEEVCTREDIENWHLRLYETNGKIWDLESAIRKGKENELGLEEVGRRAIEIRTINGQRIAIKSEIVEKIGIGYKDIKINHASESQTSKP